MAAFCGYFVAGALLRVRAAALWLRKARSDCAVVAYAALWVRCSFVVVACGCRVAVVWLCGCLQLQLRCACIVDFARCVLVHCVRAAWLVVVHDCVGVAH